MRISFVMTRVSLVLFISVLAACASGPSDPPTGTPEPDKFLFERGTAELNERKWLNAREYFRRLVDTYPQSPYRADAKLGIGDSYLGDGTTEGKILGINEFREFLTFFPTHRRADYAQYKLGMGHFLQMLSPQRDQTETREAIKEFETFVERYPNSPLMDEVREKLRESRDRLSSADYEVGMFYYRSRWYPGAIDRFKVLLSRDAQFTFRDGVYFHLAEALVRMNQNAEALPYYERLVKEFEKSEYLEQAQKRITELKDTNAKAKTF
jgi:outer membrane protein assembly factor BamD